MLLKKRWRLELAGWQLDNHVFTLYIFPFQQTGFPFPSIHIRLQLSAASGKKEDAHPSSSVWEIVSRSVPDADHESMDNPCYSSSVWNGLFSFIRRQFKMFHNKKISTFYFVYAVLWFVTLLFPYSTGYYNLTPVITWWKQSFHFITNIFQALV